MSKPSIRRILVAVDFSRCSRVALEYAIFLAAPFDASLAVLHVWDAPMYAGAEGIIVRDEDGERKTLASLVQGHARQELRAFLADFHGVPRLTSELAAGHPHEVIVEHARAHDLVVVGTHGRRALARLFLGSVAERVLRAAHCPVVTVHDEGDAAVATAAR